MRVGTSRTRDASRDIPLIARVRCRSEGSAEERPVAVEIGGEWFEIRELETDEIVGPAEAGIRSHRRVRAVLEDGRAVRLTRVLPDGDWRVYLAG